MKEIYDDNELKVVWQYNSPDTGWTICHDNLISFKAQRQYAVREAYEYIGEKQPEKLVVQSITHADYENGIQAERARIIGLIEDELDTMGFETLKQHLLTKIKQS